MPCRLLSLVVCAALLCTGCDKDQQKEEKTTPPAASEANAPAEKPAPTVTSHWSGRWQSNKAKEHAGGLTCEAAAKADGEWEATFTAEFGRTKAYKIPLKGKREGDKVVFGGEVNIGAEKGEGVFKWTGHADEKEFVGEYEGGGDKGTFKMERATKK